MGDSGWDWNSGLSVEQGNLDGQNNYRFALQYSRGVAKDERQAAKYHKLSAGQGSSDGQDSYGDCHENGMDAPNATRKRRTKALLKRNRTMSES
jgi:TPR repeat protein